ncbi:hypothetical protein BD770DRAFT_415089 [Pilaira anomala]|nr:hypothetical protein BD770DRAFT_415089 [Pilaira anomala]
MCKIALIMKPAFDVNGKFLTYFEYYKVKAVTVIVTLITKGYYQNTVLHISTQKKFKNNVYFRHQKDDYGIPRANKWDNRFLGLYYKPKFIKDENDILVNFKPLCHMFGNHSNFRCIFLGSSVYYFQQFPPSPLHAIKRIMDCLQGSSDFEPSIKMKFIAPYIGNPPSDVMISRNVRYKVFIYFNSPNHLQLNISIHNTSSLISFDLYPVLEPIAVYESLEIVNVSLDPHFISQLSFSVSSIKILTIQRCKMSESTNKYLES